MEWFVFSLGSLGPMGTTPWKLGDNSGHFEFLVKRQDLFGGNNGTIIEKIFFVM